MGAVHNALKMRHAVWKVASLLCREALIQQPNKSQALIPVSFSSAQTFSRTFASSPSQDAAQFSVLKTSGAGGNVVRAPVFAIFQVGSLQYKVCPGDLIYAERLRKLDVGAELSFNTVQAAGTKSSTLVGRPYVDGASVTAVIEEQVQDAKVISFKKRRRKNSRRIKGHRQMLTGLRITAVNGLEIPMEGSARVYAGH